MPVLTCNDVTFSYNGTPVASDINLSIEQGDYLCIVGENGSGKTTLMKGILGLQKPDSGEVIYQSIEKNEIGYLPQQSAIQKDFPASVYEVVISGCLNKIKGLPIYRKTDKEKAEKYMEWLEVTEFRKKSYRALSGGQQQRVLLARALCAADKILLLDEPVTGLDPVMSAELYDIIEKLNKERNMTIVMISHDMASAVKYGSKILHMEKTPVFYGKKEDYLQTDVYRKMTGGA